MGSQRIRHGCGTNFHFTLNLLKDEDSELWGPKPEVMEVGEQWQVLGSRVSQRVGRRRYAEGEESIEFEEALPRGKSIIRCLNRD